MTPSRHGLLFFAAIVAIAAGTRVAVAVTPDPVSADDHDAPLDVSDAGNAPGEDAADPAPATGAFVEISGAASGSLPSIGAAQTTWRYGRAREQPVDEASCRLRVSGAGRTLDGAFHGLSVGFSVALLVPALRVGVYAAGAVPGVAAAWARQDRASATPDIEWDVKDGSARDGGPAGFVVTVTSIVETSHSSERRGGVTVDVTGYDIHGAIDATLPCTRSVASLRQSCRTETIHGTF
jgi:hypothetical protein